MEIPPGANDESGQTQPFNQDWQTKPRTADLTNVPIHKAQKAYEERGTQVEFSAPEPGGRVMGDVNRVAIKDVPTQPRKFWQFWRWFEK